MNNYQSPQLSLFMANLRNGIWLLGIPSWIFGVADRTMASFADGYLSAIELSQLFTTSFLLLSWLYLKPDESFTNFSLVTQPALNPYQSEIEVDPDRGRIFKLKNHHMIGQEYLLPFSHICQIYHLLNLKHLENVHNFSLNNLRVLRVTEFEPTAIGGIIKFQTALESPVNVLRLWRQRIVEVRLILHNPYTVELSIPIYGDKKITVMFNVEPISNKEHRLFIDIYSNLNWPKPLLQIILHIASCWTLFEDLPYLQKLAERNIDKLVNLNTISSHETMALFKRFVEIYGSIGEQSQPMKKAS